MTITLRCLRPHLSSPVRLATQAVSSTSTSYYLRCYSSQQDLITPRIRITQECTDGKYKPERYPRIASEKNVVDYQTFKERYKHLVRGESLPEELVVRGMLCSTICSL